MRIHRVASPALLKSVIDYIWFVESDFLNEEKREDIIMPLGHINIIFNYGSSYALIESGERIAIPEAAVVGQIKAAKSVHYGDTLEQIGLSLKPAGLLALFKTPGQAIAEQIVSAKAFDRDLEDLYLETKSISSVEQKIQKIYDYAARNNMPDKNSMRLDEMTAYMGQHFEALNIREMAAHFSLSVSALERFFKKYVGLSPKTYGEIIKFRKSVEDAEGGQDIQNYYYDQSHLIKNTKKLTAKTFGELRDVKNELTLRHLLNSKK